MRKRHLQPPTFYDWKLMRKLFYLFSLFLLGCEGKNNLDGGGFKFFDTHTQELYIKVLKKEGVVFRINDDGSVTYSKQSASQAEKLQLAVLKASFVPSIHYEDEVRRTLFLERLKFEGIPFQMMTREGEEWITWSENDDKKVDKILSNLRETNYK